jgi:hypothetical protein
MDGAISAGTGTVDLIVRSSRAGTICRYVSQGTVYIWYVAIEQLEIPLYQASQSILVLMMRMVLLLPLPCQWCQLTFLIRS